MTRKFNYWKKRGVIELKPRPFIGNFGDCLRAKRSAGQWVQDVYNYGAGLPYVGLYLFDQPCLLIRDPEIIKSILVRDFDYFQDRFACANPSDKIGGANLVLIKNPAWKILRSALNPINTPAKLKNMFKLMIEIGNDLDTHMESFDLSGKGENLEMKELCAKFTTDVIGATALGLRINSLNNPDCQFRKCGQDLFRLSVYQCIQLVSIFFMPKFAKPFGFKLLSKKNRDFLRQTTWKALVERERSGVIKDDLVGHLVKLKKAYYENPIKGEFEFDGDNLVAQLAIFFTTGFESSSTTLSLTLYELAINPEIQAKSRKEIIEGLEQTNGEITYNLVTNLPYLDMVVSETMRKYPPLGFLDRVAHDDYKVPNTDLIIEKGTPVLISMTGMHYDPQYFPHPDKYDPERFSDKNKKLRKSCVYFPFGDGPHICIGMRIGLLQIKFGLIKLLNQYEFSPCKQTQIPLRISPKCLTATSEEGIFVNVKKFVTK